MSILADLFLTFAKVGVMTFGGGYAMLPILQREVVEKKGWATAEELLDYYAIAQCTPGVIAVNTATFVGRKQKGIIGGVTATCGVVFPSLIIIIVIAAFLSNFADIPAVQHGLAGVRICVCALVGRSAAGLLKKTATDIPTWCIYIISVVCAFFLHFSPIITVVSAAAAGIIIKKVKAEK